MNQYVAQLPWTDEQWSRVVKTVKQEAERTRVAAKFLPVYGPIGDDQIAVPSLTLGNGVAPLIPQNPPAGLTRERLDVNSAPDTVLATISMLVYVRNHEAADPEMQAALTMFRRAANLIGRTEDALMLNGQEQESVSPPAQGGAIGPVQVTYGRKQFGLVGSPLLPNPPGPHPARPVQRPAGGNAGQRLVGAVIEAITTLDQSGYGGPFACVLGRDLYRDAHTPTDSLTLPRHTITPMLGDGPLLLSSLVPPEYGAVISYGSGQVEQVLASDISVKLLYVSEEPRFVFRVAERVALRVRDWGAVVNITPPPRP
jgi:uncharacterized linocin/CFP29 family protein